MAAQTTLALYFLLMFIGGGSAGTAGGVKVGTVGILLATIRAELRGDQQVIVAHRAIRSRPRHFRLPEESPIVG